MRFASVFILLILAGSAFALKPVPQNPLATAPTYCDERGVGQDDGNRVIDGRDGSIQSVFDLAEGPFPGTPEQAARTFLKHHEDWVGVDPVADNLRMVRTVESPMGHHVTFERIVRGIPVYPGDLVVTFDKQNKVVFYFSSLFNVTGDLPTATMLSAENAVEIAYRHLNPMEKSSDAPQTALVVWAGDNRDAAVCWRVRQYLSDPMGDWEVLVDAQNGTIRRVVDRARNIDGTGLVFRPDPLTTAGATYGSAGYTDGNDASTPQLFAQEFLDTLRDITLVSGVYKLQGPACRIADFESPTVAPVTATHPDSFRFNRQAQGFEDVMVYYQITLSQAWIQSLGFNNIQNTSMQIDPHGVNGDDNSHFIPSTNRIAYGEGGVDDAEDADVIWHEYGHAIQSGTVPGWGGGDEDAMGEGFGDYWAASYSHTISTFHDRWVYNWDGHNPYWDGRTVNANYTYPANNTDIYSGGQIWSQACFETMLDIGRATMDQMVLQHHFMLGSTSTMPTAARALIAADQALNGDVNRNFLFARFQPRGLLPAAPTFALLSPVGSEVWPIDSTVTVTWNPGGLASRVRIQISRTGSAGPWTLLGDSLLNTGRADFVISGPNCDSTRIRLSYLGTPARSDSSDSNFVIASVSSIYQTSFETEDTTWSHASSGGTWVDQWARSPMRVHADTASYHCGDPEGGNYLSRLDACLYSPLFSDLPDDAMLSFWHYMDAETINPFGADSVNDGGMLEVSLNGADFVQVFPTVGAYNAMIKRSTTPSGPFARGAKVWGGTTDWQKVELKLAAYAGNEVQFRFRFGSNASTGREGWYIDNFQIYSKSAVPAPTRLTCRYDGTNVLLRWASAGPGMHYRIYSSAYAEGPYDTVEGVTDLTTFSLPPTSVQEVKFFIVRTWDGNE
jgi:hypothetical protein